MLRLQKLFLPTYRCFSVEEHDVLCFGYPVTEMSISDTNNPPRNTRLGQLAVSLPCASCLLRQLRYRPGVVRQLEHGADKTRSWSMIGGSSSSCRSARSWSRWRRRCPNPNWSWSSAGSGSPGRIMWRTWSTSGDYILIDSSFVLIQTGDQLHEWNTDKNGAKLHGELISNHQATEVRSIIHVCYSLQHVTSGRR